MALNSKLEANFPEWNKADFEVVLANTRAIKILRQELGKGFNGYEDACLKFLRLVINDKQDELCENIHTTTDVRALTFLLVSSDKFQKVTITKGLIDGLIVPRNPISSISLLQVINLFFNGFDQLMGNGSALLSDFIKEQLLHHAKKRGESDLKKLSINRDLIFNLNGPVLIVSKAKEKKQDLDVCFRFLGINGSASGRFHDVCRYNYYLETLKEIKIGSNDPILNEVCKKEVYLSPGIEGMLLGHEILSILIDRAPAQEVSDSWQKTILTIAGDPRVTSSHPLFQQWWALLTEERVRKVKSWLSRFDLKLFLRVLESYGRDTGNTELVRMFPARKKLLEGLLDQGLVQHTRLFLSNHADQFTKRNYKKGEIPQYATVNTPDISMIYLQVGNLHVIEGTHNFKFWVFPAIPYKAAVLNYSRKQFEKRELSGGLHNLYNQEFGFNDPVADITHAPKNCNWQNKAINYLQGYGIKLNIETLFSKEDYLLYRRLYGLPYSVSQVKKVPISKIKKELKSNFVGAKSLPFNKKPGNNELANRASREKRIAEPINKKVVESKVAETKNESAIKSRVTSRKTSSKSRRCLKCHKRKSVTEFYRAEQEMSGYSKWCRKCFETTLDETNSMRLINK